METLTIEDHRGQVRTLPINRERLVGLKLFHQGVDYEDFTTAEFAKMSPVEYVIMVCQLYAAQKELPQPGDHHGETISNWFVSIIIPHAEQDAAGVGWAALVLDAVNELEVPAKS